MSAYLTPKDLDRAEQIRRLAPVNEIYAIAEAVAMLSGLTVDDIMGRRLDQHAAEARQLVMHVASRRGFSKSAIGRAMDRDHTTVAHGVRAEAARRGELDEMDRMAKAGPRVPARPVLIKAAGCR